MGKAYDVPGGSAPPTEESLDATKPPGWVDQLNQGAAAVAASGIPGVTTPAASDPITEQLKGRAIRSDLSPAPPVPPVVPATDPAPADAPVVAPALVDKAITSVAEAPITSPVPAVTGNLSAAEATAPAVDSPKPKKIECIIRHPVNCTNKQQTRGLCTKCYAAAGQWVKVNPNKGWDYLVAKGIALDPARDIQANKFLAALESAGGVITP